VRGGEAVMQATLACDDVADIPAVAGLGRACESST